MIIKRKKKILIQILKKMQIKILFSPSNKVRNGVNNFKNSDRTLVYITISRFVGGKVLILTMRQVKIMVL